MTTTSASLKPRSRAEVLDRLRSEADAVKALGVTSLYLFGSALRDEIGPASDVDVFVDYDPQGPFNAFDLVAAKRHLEEQLGVRVDLTTRRGLHPLIRAEVEKTALRVF